ncbi:SCO family protein [Sphingobacterium sp. SYP-B4668]|uniref:SCO family protein n=1 Tax=Sphingobacterium sp. SYP-B4668 TaxID=2996035 RepID=UPI0022DDCFCB|nr:SCO family protein [Sphingobacterium sp. SYP-B4668]
MQNTSRKKGISTLIILAMVLLLPGFLYVLVNRMGASNTYVKLPIYGEKVLSGTVSRKMGREFKDTLFHQVPVIQFTDMNGKTVNFIDNDSTISVVHLFYTKDKSFSRTMINRLNAVATNLKRNPKVRFYSISVDSNSDTPEILKIYAQGYRSEEKNWSFLTSPSVDILKFAREELLLDAMVDTQDSSKLIIGSSYVLLDSQRRIRGFYDLNLTTELERLEEEVKVQLVEEFRNIPTKVEKRD